MASFAHNWISIESQLQISATRVRNDGVHINHQAEVAGRLEGRALSVGNLDRDISDIAGAVGIGQDTWGKS